MNSSLKIQDDLLYTITTEDNADLEGWIKAQWSELETKLHSHGAILLRGFDVANTELDSILNWCGETPLEYKFRSTPRTNLSGKTYTTTEYPQDRAILQHNENAYSNHWPKRLWFKCVIDEFSQGQTPLTCSRKVLAKIPAEIQQEFVKRKLRFERNFNAFIDLSWQDAFCTSDKAAVEQYCNKNNIELIWTDEGLTTLQTCEPIQTHPVTGEQVWFNQAHVFHPYAQGESYRVLLDSCGVLPPRNVVFADDGSAIPDEMIKIINDVYQDLSLTFDWRKNDILIIDNLLVAHGRAPYEGNRKIVLAMT
ncbi:MULTISPECIES: TauD/TfdA family dioxygenase [Pseudoalteromonas]|uniref:TauD/TfdA-like domain-containing protein n=1 Tax=Pseudoalteromonas amylolytica TaxID=1859457 RepID=A0A1S1MTU4_9GAMM|nr:MULTISPECIES: TauD/TfdA family dioxygenase [Pseudoalteromonas]OHU84901.1 hypothetical protein BFC16_19620 [Pseudoalteromonas sp. JW3]OHU90148.1 hypothetical protein BET10_15355 [Pseudoalteromonas amylolytica]